MTMFEEMEVDSFQFLLRQRDNFDDVLQLMGALLFSSPFRFYARFRPEDKELVVQLLLFSLLNNLFAPPSAYDFSFQRVSIGDYYYFYSLSAAFLLRLLI
ncbi:hypothetical protein OUZ56_029723 [Daphnia magna]|uniref:Uncharacterized protein n=1 Tax=Daphnia magna TaxID=35525 RepID=A0ABR0B7M9_9CRUS|nr:hypothetical protein OUZ56_029723 [Daphnia magna]